MPFQIIRRALYVWILNSVVFSQSLLHHKDPSSGNMDPCTPGNATLVVATAVGNAGGGTAGKTDPGALILTLIFNFPIMLLIIQTTLLAWLEMGDILDNPFGFDKDYDLDLSEVSSSH